MRKRNALLSATFIFLAAIAAGSSAAEEALNATQTLRDNLKQL